MKKPDIVNLRGWGAAPSRFDKCKGIFSSRNECFRGKEESKHRSRHRTTYSESTRPFSEKKSTVVESYWEDDVKSCQGSSVLWCSYALKGSYSKDPHKNYKDVWTIQKEIDKVAKWNQDWSSMTELYKSQLLAGMTVAKLPMKGGEQHGGKGDQVLKDIISKKGVVLIGSDGWHVTAAAFTTNGVYYYDNDVGCCWCPDDGTWMEWVKFCYMKCKDSRFGDDTPLTFIQVG